MADQTIALQARAPQGNSMAAAIRQNSQLMNMMTQQAAAQRQSAVAEQQMQLAQAEEARDVSAANIKLAGDKIDYYTKRAGQTMNPEGYAVLLQDLDKDAPEIAATFRTNMPPEQFDRGVLLQMVGSVSDNFKANYGPLETEVVQAPDGTFGVAVTGGVGKKKPGVYELEQFNLRRDGGAPAAAAPTSAAPQQGGAMAQPTRGANTSPQDLMRQGVNPNSIPSGNPLSPISTGGGAQPDLGAIVQQMMQTGVISQADMGLMTQAAGPEKAQQLAQIMRENNIQIMPSEGEAPGMSNAVFRPGVDAMPERQNVQSMDDYYATGQAARGRDLNQGAIPGSSRVPIPRVRAEAEAGRPSPQDAYNTQRAETQANADVKFLETAPGAMRTVTTNLGLLNRMIGDARVDEKTDTVIYPAKGRKPHPGFDQAVGLGFPGLRLISGSPEADFDALLTQVTGATFLEAFETLKGGGQITEKEGEKATKAISRLSLNLSEKEFIHAVDELRSIMQAGLQRAETRAARLRGGATPSRGAGAPTTSGIPQGAIDKLRKNPSLRGAFDAKYGAGAAARALGGR